MGKFIDLTGQKFGRLTVIKRVENDKHQKTRFLCRCDCGNEKVINGSSLKRGLSKSCGCLNNELLVKRAIHDGNYRHGLRKNKLYPIWNMMIQRCINPNNSRYKTYGGRGIQVCEEWQHSFKAFYDYVSKLPHFNETGYSLDRINNDGNYEPSNIKWSNKVEQANKRTSNVYYFFNGEYKTLAQWCREFNAPYKLVHRRITRCKMSLLEALKR